MQKKSLIYESNEILQNYFIQQIYKINNQNDQVIYLVLIKECIFEYISLSKIKDFNYVSIFNEILLVLFHIIVN